MKTFENVVFLKVVVIQNNKIPPIYKLKFFSKLEIYDFLRPKKIFIFSVNGKEVPINSKDIDGDYNPFGISFFKVSNEKLGIRKQNEEIKMMQFTE